MVRSKSSRTVNDYDFLSSLYDDLMQDPDGYDYWLAYFDRYIKGTDILELASGDGILASILTKRGYSVLASDISIAMRERAKINYEGPYEIIDMRHIDLDHDFDAILCICDSMNYLNDEDDLRSTLKSAYDHLKDGGVFIFDMHSLKRLDEFKETYIEKGSVDGIDYKWTIEADALTNTLRQHFSFCLDDEIIEETHIQHVFAPDIVIEALKEIGYNVTCIKDFIEDEKDLYIGEKLL